MPSSDTIVAIATPLGAGGVGIVRISGPQAADIATRMLGGTCPDPRYALYTSFCDDKQNVIDQGIALFFKAPHSFTGEDVLELQGHGGMVVMEMLVEQATVCGARPARPGEFTERAFLNDKIDLTQAEAIADLITAESRQAVKAAVNSMQGVFSEHINLLVEKLIRLRIHVEAALDFPEEEVDFLADHAIQIKLDEILLQLQQVRHSAIQGRLLKDGMRVVIAGKPNTGKSSLLNALAGQESAIVTDIPGTTRDVLREHIQIDGMPLHIIDTAGLRDSADIVEQEGVRRAHTEIEKADRVLYLTDCSTDDIDLSSLPITGAFTLVHNKIDLVNRCASVEQQGDMTHIYVSAKTGEGVDLLKHHLKQCMGFQHPQEGLFIARRRHLQAIEEASQHLGQAQYALNELKAGELLAEELRSAQQSLSRITGAFNADDLLGRIFADFCIGK